MTHLPVREARARLLHLVGDSPEVSAAIDALILQAAISGADPVGVPEISARTGRGRSTINNSWRKPERQMGFPEPRWTVGGGPAWEWAEVVDWLVHRLGQDPVL